MMDLKRPNASLFIWALMRSGARIRAERIFSDAMHTVLDEIGHAFSADHVLWLALEKNRPCVAVKTRRIGDVSYEVPVIIGYKNGLRAAARFIVAYARMSKGKSMGSRLAIGLLAAFRGEL